MDFSKTISPLSEYCLNSLEYLSENFPTIPLELFDKLNGVSSALLNALFDIVGKCYLMARENTGDLLTALLSVYNFYLRTQETSSLKSLMVGFMDMVNTIFGFSKIPNLFKLVVTMVTRVFDSVSKYFLRAEGAESTMSKFWSIVENKDPRSIINIVYELSGVSATCALVYNLYCSGKSISSIQDISDIVTKNFLDTRSELRLQLKSTSQAIARVIDFICLNYENFITGNLQNISWKLPGPIKFENDFAQFCDIYERYLSNPAYLEEVNLTLVNLRDRAQKLIDTANSEISRTQIGAVKSSMVRYLQTLNHHHLYLTEQLNPNNTKPQPMSLVLYGPPGCGKSSVATSIGKIMQSIAGRTPDEDKIKNRGGDPKFEPAITTSTEVIISDDFGNDMSNSISAKEVLDIVNVTKEVIPKASVEEKNKYRYSNIGTIFTTNDLNVGINQIRTISYESILRRYGLVVKMIPLPEYCIEGTEVLNRNHPYLKSGAERDDIYTIEILRPITTRKSSSRQAPLEIQYEIIDGWKQEGMSEFKSFIIFIRKYLKREWAQNVAQHASRNSPERICPHCQLEKLVCVCKEDEMNKITPEALFGLELYYNDFHEGLASLPTKLSERYAQFDSTAQIYLDATSRRITRLSLYRYSMYTLYSYLSWMFTHRYPLGVGSVLYIILSSLSYSVFVSPFLLYTIFLLYKRSRARYQYGVLSSLLLLGSIYPTHTALATVVLFPYLCYLFQKEQKRLECEAQYLQRARAIREYYYARMSFYTVLGASTSLIALLLSLKIFSYFMKSSGESKYNIATEPYLPIFQKTNSDDKAKYHFIPQPSNAARTSSRSEAIDYIGKKLVVVKIITPLGVQTVRGIPCGSELLLPAHVIPTSGRFTVEICADNTKRTSVYRDRDVGQDSYRLLRDRNGKAIDAVLLHMSNMPVQPDLLRYFVESQQPIEGPGQELYKEEDGTFRLIDLRLTTPRIWDIIQYEDPYRGMYKDYPAIKCRAQESSFEGMCGSPILSEDSNCILGFHVAGNATTTWYGLRITLDMIKEARQSLLHQSKNFVAHPMPYQFVVDRDNTANFQFEPESRVHAIESIGEKTSPIEEIGMIYRGDEVYADRAEKHYFPNSNPGLEDAFGPRNTQPPKYPNGDVQINATLKKLHNPKFDIPIDLIDRAVDDYLDGSTNLGANFNNIIASLKEERHDFFSVRDLDEALKGDQTGIVRGINNTSSAGWIYGKKKYHHYNFEVEGDPYEVRDLNANIRNDIKKQEMKWRRGEGTYDPFKRCSKTNELLPWKKAEEKTRSFYSNDMTFFLNMTRGIIPLKHILRKDKHLSECFVGITPQSKDWADLKNFLTKNGQFSKFVCGDFSGYDTQLPKALLDKAAWILVEMARRGGMSASDLDFLRGALTSVTSPTLFWQGHVLRMANGQPSGQPLTVEINSIINSLLMRMVFFTIMDENYPHLAQANYRDYVSLATYGDDNALGVHDAIPKYNHTNIQSVFARWGISYTMADKDADSVPYQTIDEISFLKRSFRYHKELGVVAPIEYDSIVKGFYYWVRPKNTPLDFRQQFRELVKSQVREAALHGEAFYMSFCEGIRILQRSSEQMKEEFQIKWNGFDIPTYSELIKDLSYAYE